MIISEKMTGKAVSKKSMALLVFFIFTLSVVPAATAEETVIADGKTARFHYDLRVGETLVESSRKSDPVEYVHGGGQIVPGLESRLAGLKAGDRRSVPVPSMEAYGASDPSAVLEVPKTQFDSGEIRVGSVVTGPSVKGQIVKATVKSVGEDSVVLDFNHPLAGKDLLFDVEVLEVT